ncbi:MAG: hypothetical protein WDW38_007391 [Sanguina aurantia]
MLPACRRRRCQPATTVQGLQPLRSSGLPRGLGQAVSPRAQAEDGELLPAGVSPPAQPATLLGPQMTSPGSQHRPHGEGMLASEGVAQQHGQPQSTAGSAPAAHMPRLRAVSALRGVCQQLHGMMAVASALASLSSSPRGGLGLAGLALQQPLGSSSRLRLGGASQGSRSPPHCRVSRQLLQLCLACDWVSGLDS